MPIVILFILIGLPLVEISIFAEVGGKIGGFWTVILTVATAVIGITIVRFQGLIVMAQAKENMERGAPLVDEAIHGIFLFLAGVLLLIPGFLTDAIGAILLLPPVRLLIGRAGLAKAVLGNPRPQPRYDQHGNIIIEGQYVIHNEDDKDSGTEK